MNAARMYECYVEYMPYYFRLIHPILLSYEGEGITLNENQIKVLLATYAHPNIAPAELSRIFMIPKSSLTTIIRSLVKMDLLIPEMRPENERNYSLAVSSFGQKIAERMKKQHEKQFVSLFSSFPEEEMESAIKGISLISAYLKKQEENSGK